jgi:hypothetical protein
MIPPNTVNFLLICVHWQKNAVVAKRKICYNRKNYAQNAMGTEKQYEGKKAKKSVSWSGAPQTGCAVPGRK